MYDMCIFRWMRWKNWPERGAQTVHESQRSAEIDDISGYRTSLRETRYRLVDDRAEDARRYVLFSGALVYQRLNIALREDSASRRYRIDLLAAV